jgi:hypothetical protein
MNSPNNAERRPLGKGAVERETDRDQTETETTVHHYTTALPLVPALLTDAWITEVLLTVRLRHALRLLVAALSLAEEVHP